MPTDNQNTQFTAEERYQIINDVLRWKLEYEKDRAFPPEELQKFVDLLRSKTDSELKAFWETTVGEWLASRGDLEFRYKAEKPRIVEWYECLSPKESPTEPGEKIDFDHWLELQFQKLINGLETDYGFIIQVDLEPPLQSKA